MISKLSGVTFLFILCVIFQNAFAMDADEDFKTQGAPNLHHIALSLDPVESFLSSYNSKMEVDKLFCNQLKEYCHKQIIFYDTILKGNHTQITLQEFCVILSKMIGDQVLCRINQENAEKIIGQLLWDYQSIRDTWSGRHIFFSTLNKSFSEPSEESLSSESFVESTTSLMSRINVWITILNDIPAFFERYQDKYTQELCKPLVVKQGKQSNVTNDSVIRTSALTAAIKTIDNFTKNMTAIQSLLFLLCKNDERLLQNNMHNLGYFGLMGNKVIHQGMLNLDSTLLNLIQLRASLKTTIRHL